MDLRKKIKKINSYYKENGLTETICYVNKKTKQVITTKYPFMYRYPQVITIQIMDICNLKCRHCHLQAQVDSNSRGFMEYHFFEQIIGRISHLINRAVGVNFNSVEALFHNRIFEMIDLVRKQNKYIHIHINTNGMLFDERRIDDLLERKIYNFSLSLDGCRKETVESFKTEVDFDRVIKNIKRLKERGGSKVRIFVNFVVHKNNINELIDFIYFCKSLGLTSINISGFASHTQEMSNYCLYSWSGIKEIDAIFHKAISTAETIGIKLSYRGTKLEAGGCFASDCMYIDKNANIVPCVLLSKKTHMNLLDKIGISEQIIWGNVLEEDPYKIWTSKASVNFRRLLHKNKLPEECTLCAIGYKVIC